MLDQLDDPVPFTPSPELVAAAKSRGTPAPAPSPGRASPGR